MKRFLIFTGDDYYPCGGFSDFDSAHDTLNEALTRYAELHLEDSPLTWGHIVDMEELKIIPEETILKSTGNIQQNI